MAINKKKNCSLQCTISRKRMEHLNAVVEAFNEKGVQCTKSDIVSAALDLYLKSLVAYGLSASEKAEEPHKEKKDA